MQAHLGDVPGAGQRDRMCPDHPGPRTGGEDEHPVAERDGFLQVVGDEHDRLPFFLPEGQQVVLHQFARLHVERAEGLVHQEDRRPHDQALRQRHALAHAAGQLMWEAVLEPCQPNARQPPAGFLGRAPSRPAMEERPQHHVLQRGLPREQDVLLKEVGGLPVEALERGVEAQDAPARGAEQPRGQAQDRGLPAAGRSDDRQEFSARHRKRDPVERLVRRAAGDRELPAHLLQRERRPGLLRGYFQVAYSAAHFSLGVTVTPSRWLLVTM